jgi:hypothetical protein
MKGIRFYLEYESPRAKRENRNTGNCVAVIGKEERHGMVITVGAYNAGGPNWECMESNATMGYLKEHATPIPEPIARIIHPKLFEVLDNLNSKNI